MSGPALRRNAAPLTGRSEPHYRAFAGWLERTPPARIAQKRDEAERAFHRVGITFAVYGEEDGTERLIPVRHRPAHHSRGRVEAARARAAAARAGAQRSSCTTSTTTRRSSRPARMPAGAGARQRAVPPRDARAWTCPAASTRTSPASTSCAPAQGEYYVLEDNLRVPSGVSYMLENRKMMMRLVPGALRDAARSARSSTTRTCCSRTCARVAPAGEEMPTVVVLTPGAVQLGLLRARVPRPADGRRTGRGPGPLRRRTTPSSCAPRSGPQRVDVIYRRVDDDFLDPLRVPRRTRCSACPACSPPTAPAG